MENDVEPKKQSGEETKAINLEKKRKLSRENIKGMKRANKWVWCNEEVEEMLRCV